MIKAIFAIDAFGGMGFNGKIPWPHCSEDFKWFKENTEGHIVVMGRKTWDSVDMPSPLPNRHNIVISKDRNFRPAKAEVWRDNWIDRLRDLDMRFSKDRHIWIIGGPGIIEQAKPWIKEFYVTRWKGAYQTDVKLDTRKFFLDLRCRTVHPSREQNQLTFEIHIPWLSI